MKYLVVFLLSIIIYGCCSTSTITVTEIDTIAIKDTAQLADLDSVWVGAIHNGKDSIGSLAVYPKSRKAVVNIKWLKPDSVLVEIEDTKYLVLSQTLEKILTATISVMPFWQKLLVLILVATGLYITYKLWRK